MIRLDRDRFGRVMCCICFEFKELYELRPTSDMRREDVCIECYEDEHKLMASMIDELREKIRNVS